MLTGKELANSGMITEFDENNIQQQGIDLRVENISKIKNKGMGVVPATGKTVLPQYEKIEPLHYKNGDTKVFGWMLPAGVYDIEFVEGVNVGVNFCMKPLTRSSLVRMGARIDSGLYDAGFHTDHCGAMLFVNNPIVIEKGARLAQIICLESNEVENTYNGQFQNDKQRNNV